MDINARLEKLERENRRMRKIGIVAGVVVSMFIVGGQAKTNKVVEANEFHLVDASGKVRAKLSMVLTEPSLSFRDANGDEVVALGNYGGLPNLSLGKDKSPRAFLSAGSPDGWPSPTLSLVPAEGHLGSVAAVAPDRDILTLLLS